MKSHTITLVWMAAAYCAVAPLSAEAADTIPPGRPWTQPLRALKEKAPLSVEQKAQLKDILTQHKDLLKAQLAARKEAAESLRAARQESSDDAALLAAADQAAAAVKAGILLRGQLRDAIAPLLTDEQKAAIKAAMSAHGQEARGALRRLRDSRLQRSAR